MKAAGTCSESYSSQRNKNKRGKGCRLQSKGEHVTVKEHLCTPDTKLLAMTFIPCNLLRLCYLSMMHVTSSPNLLPGYKQKLPNEFVEFSGECGSLSSIFSPSQFFLNNLYFNNIISSICRSMNYYSDLFLFLNIINCFKTECF